MMTNRLNILSALLTSTLALSAQSFKVELVTGDAADGKTLVVKPFSHSQAPVLAEAVVKNGKCVLKGKLPAAGDTIGVELSVKDCYGYAKLVLVSGDDLKAACQLEESGKGRNDVPIYYFKDFKAENSPLTEKYQNIRQQYSRLRDLFSQRRQRISDYSKSILDTIAAAHKANNLRRVNELYKTVDYRVYALADSVYYRDFGRQSHELLASLGDGVWGPMMLIDFYNFLTPKERPVFDAMSDRAKLSYHGRTAAEELYPGGQAGQKARDFSITDEQGNQHTLKQLMGSNQYLLLDFWASWCVPCRKEIPNVKRQYELYKDKGLQVVSISIDRNEAAWRKALNEEKLSWPNFLDRGEVAKIYNVKAIPAMFLIKSDGTIVATGEDARGTKLASRLAELLP